MSWSPQYQAEHPDVKINFLERGYAEHHDALLAALATGEVPDIAAIEVGYMSKFKAQPENFVNMLDYGAADLEKDYLPWRWEQAVSADGSSVIGIPTDVGGMATCYRADLFEAAGLPTDPAEVSALWPDWESFIATGKQYTDATGKAFIDSARGSVFNLVARQGDEEFYKTGDPNTTVYADNPQVKKAWDLSVAAIDAGISANIDQFSPEWNAGMANGDFAVLGCPAWMMGYIQGQAPDTAGKWNIAGHPGEGRQLGRHAPDHPGRVRPARCRCGVHHVGPVSREPARACSSSTATSRPPRSCTPPLRSRTTPTSSSRRPRRARSTATPWRP